MLRKIIWSCLVLGALESVSFEDNISGFNIIIPQVFYTLSFGSEPFVCPYQMYFVEPVDSLSRKRSGNRD